MATNKRDKQITEVHSKNASIGSLILIIFGIYSLALISNGVAYGQNPPTSNLQT